jgi:glycosyltransferase involved in cell wall biosynthesis
MIPSQSTAPVLSICIPAYNRPEWLRRAVLSILTTATAQQAQIEIVVSDDSTIPDCQQVVHELMANWQGHWQYKPNSPSRGMAANWNQCLQMAKGDYVLMLHDDDYLEADAPSQIIQALQQSPSAIALLFGVNIVTPEKQIRKRQITQSQQYLTPEVSLTKLLTNSSFIRFPGIVLKKEIFEDIGYFDEAIGGIADIQMWARICHKYGLLCMPIITANYTVHASALTMKMFNLQTLRGLEKLFSGIESQLWLPTKTLEACKANYFHQFILAGTVRYLKALNFKRAREVFSLFSQIDILDNRASLKWQATRAVLQLFLLFQKPFISEQQSSEV